MSTTTINAPSGERIVNPLRVAGIGALLAAACYLAQPLLVVFQMLPEYPTAAEIRAASWMGPYQLLFFTGSGIGTLLLVTGVRRASSGDTASRIAERLGVTAAIGWFVTAGFAWTSSSSMLTDVSDITADLSVQRAIIMASFQGTMAGVVITSIGVSGWLTWLAVAGRREGVTGGVFAASAAVLVVATVVPLLLGQPPFGLPLLIVFLAALGIALVRRSRAGR